MKWVLGIFRHVVGLFVIGGIAFGVWMGHTLGTRATASILQTGIETSVAAVLRGASSSAVPALAIHAIVAVIAATVIPLITVIVIANHERKYQNYDRYITHSKPKPLAHDGGRRSHSWGHTDGHRYTDPIDTNRVGHRHSIRPRLEACDPPEPRLKRINRT